MKLSVKIPTGEFAIEVDDTVACGFELLNTTNTIECDGFGGSFDENQRRIIQYFEHKLFLLDDIEEIRKMNFYLRMKNRYIHTKYKRASMNMGKLFFKDIDKWEASKMKSLIAHTKCNNLLDCFITYGRYSYRLGRLTVDQIGEWCTDIAGKHYFLDVYFKISIGFMNKINELVKNMLGPHEADNDFTIEFVMMELKRASTISNVRRFESVPMQHNLFILVPLAGESKMNLSLQINNIQILMPDDTAYAVLFDGSRPFRLPDIENGSYVVFMFTVKYKSQVLTRKHLMNCRSNEMVPFMLSTTMQNEFKSLLLVDEYFWNAVVSQCKNVVMSNNDIFADFLKNSINSWKIGWLDPMYEDVLCYSSKIWILQDMDMEKPVHKWTRSEFIIPGLIFSDCPSKVISCSDSDSDDESNVCEPKLFYVFNYIKIN